MLWSLSGITDVLAAVIGKRDSNMLIAPFRELASTEHQWLLASHLGECMFRLVPDIHFCDIGSLYWESLQRHAPCRIVRMSVNRLWKIFRIASWLIHVPIDCRHPFIKYWQPLQAKTTAKWSLLHPEKEHQRSVNSFSCCRFGNHAITVIFTFITESLTAIIGKNTIYQR